MSISELIIGSLPIGEFTDQQSVSNTIFDLYEKHGFAIAVSINAEVVMLARADSAYRNALVNQCNVRFADGVGVVKAVKHKQGVSIPRLPGCEIWEVLMAEATTRQASVFLVGASAEVIKRTQIKLIEKYQTPIVGYQDGYFDDDLKLIEDIKVSGAKIITVAMGIPRQEQFIFKCRDAGINAIFMGVGGTYDVFTGNVKRAPLIWQNAGLEWLYRLLSQPTRWRRQVNLLRFVWLYMNKRL
jgi:UDP-N-acetyl-D-mannosaminouronate:lipid I N-acetyl-D-mannosaminouronosyltransferase